MPARPTPAGDGEPAAARTAAPPGRPGAGRLGTWRWPLLVGGLSLALTAALWQHERGLQDRALRRDFDAALRQAGQRVEQRLASYEQTLRGLRGLFEVAAPVDQERLDTYVERLQAGADFAGLRLLGQAALQRGGAADDSARVRLLAPRLHAEALPPGRDLLAEPALRAAMLQAADAGTAVLAPLPPAAAGRPAASGELLMFMPLYGPGPAPGSARARRARLAGWVFASFRVPDLMSSLYGEGTPGLQLQVHDGVDSSDATRIYPPGPPPPPGPPARLQAQEFLGFAGHSWTLQLRSTPAFERLQGSNTPQVIALGGTLLSAALTLLTWLLATGRARAHDTAQEMTRQLRDSERSYRRIVETASEGIWVLDADGRTRFANPALAEFLGWPAPALAGRAWTEFMDPASRARLAGLDLAHRPQGPADRLELGLVHRDGSTLWASVSTSPILDAQGRPGGVLAMVTDIGERHRAEARRAQLEDQLRQAQKMEAVGTLAGGIAHDFNNILAAVLGNAALLGQDLAADHPAQERLAQITLAAQRARTLVQQIVDFSRRQPQQRLPQPLRPLVEETLRLLRATLPARVALQPELAAAPLQVEADGTQLQQVLMNLCTNAWHALPDGAGRIVVGLDETALDDAAAEPLGLPPGRWARLWVRDDGCGMDEATRQRVFEPFFTTKPVGSGTGLGLAVVHGIVRVHGGAIRVDSAPGRGSTFEVLLPLCAAPDGLPAADAPAGPAVAASAPAAPATPPAGGGGAHVLYVDDDPVMGVMVEALLQRQGYRVSWQQDPQQALSQLLAADAAVDLVVTDHNMPGMTGLELAHRLAERRPTLPVLVSTGHVTDALRDGARRVGVRHVLQKEYTLEQLAPLVRQTLAAGSHPG